MRAGLVLLALLSIGSFVARGEGTPAPFDAPRKVVVQGPYRWVRNPMHVGGLLLLAGIPLVLSSPAMLAFSGAWTAGPHARVQGIPEPP